MNGEKHGCKVLARGKGINKMLDVCYKKGFTISNSVLVVKDTGDLDSSWIIYNK